MYALGREALSHDIVRPEQNNNMDQCHANRQRYQCDKCQPVLLEQRLRANKPPGDAEDDDNSRKESAPPADEQRWLIVLEGAGGRRGRVERHRDHAQLQHQAITPVCRAQGTLDGAGSPRSRINRGHSNVCEHPDDYDGSGA